MATCILGNCIRFTNCDMCQSDTGFCMTGTLYHQGLCDTRSLQGSTAGYFYSGVGVSNNVDCVPFASDTNATAVANDFEYTLGSGGSSSSENGYAAGGQPAQQTRIQKFNFATEADMTCIGDLTAARYSPAGASSFEHGYQSTGFGTRIYCRIDRFPFASDTNATCVGQAFTGSRWSVGGMNSFTDGFQYSGTGGPLGTHTCLSKYPFASSSNGSCVGNASPGQYSGQGSSSDTCIFAAGGGTSGGTSTIRAWAIASGGSGVSHGTLTSGRYYIGPTGVSSTTHGYTAGGDFSGPENCTIDKYATSSSSNATDIGDLTSGRNQSAGMHV